MPDIVSEVGEDASSMAQHYNTVAWQHAMVYIVKSSSDFKDISLDFIVTPIASHDTRASERLLTDSTITHMLKKLKNSAGQSIAKRH